MPIEIGRIEAIYRYPVKSMRGELLQAADLGWHGIDGDRRLAFQKLDDPGGFPFLSASKLPELVRMTPLRRGGSEHVLLPGGRELPLFGEELAAEVGRRCGLRVRMMRLNHGIFDEACISVIASGTVREIGRLAQRDVDARRFRPNILVRSAREVPFEEDEWVGGVLRFGEEAAAPAVAVTLRDLRCSMVNLDPDSAAADAEVMKAVVRANDNTAGVYCAVTRTGRLAVGQRVILESRA